MGQRKMRIRIGLDGRTQIKVEGAQGESCLSFTQAIEQALGNVETREMTEDYYLENQLSLEDREYLKEGGL